MIVEDNDYDRATETLPEIPVEVDSETELEKLKRELDNTRAQLAESRKRQLDDPEPSTSSAKQVCRVITPREIENPYCLEPESSPEVSPRINEWDENDNYQPVKTMLDVYENRLKLLKGSGLWSRITARRKFMSFIIDFNGDVRPGIEPITPYRFTDRTFDGRPGEEQINFNNDPCHVLCTQPISAFKVSNDALAYLNSAEGSRCTLGTNLRKFLASLRGEKNPEAYRRSITIMKHNKVSDECGAKSGHYHILLSFEDNCDNVGQKNFYRACTDELLRPMKVIKKVCKNPERAMAYMVEPGPGRSFLGSTDADIVAMCNKERRFMAENKMIDTIPFPQDDSMAPVSDALKFYDKVYSTDHKVKQIADKILTSQDANLIYAHDFLATVMISLNLSSTDLENVQREVYGLPVARCSDHRRLTLFKVLTHQHAGRMLWIMYICKKNRTTFKDNIGTVGTTWQPDEYGPTMDKVRNMFNAMLRAPDWFVQLFQVYPILLGALGKMNCVYLWGPPDLGKTTVFKKAMLWASPHAYPSMNTGNFSFSELYFPHVLAIVDDYDPLLDNSASELLKHLKCMCGGEPTVVNVKNKTNCITMVSPVIWLSNEPNFQINILSETHVAALKVRIRRVEMNNNYPYRNDPKFWEYMHQLILKLLVKEHTDDLLRDPELLANLIFRKIKRIFKEGNGDNFLLSVCSKPMHEYLMTTQTTWTEGSIHSFYDTPSEISDSDNTMDVPVSGD